MIARMALAGPAALATTGSSHAATTAVPGRQAEHPAAMTVAAASVAVRSRTNGARVWAIPRFGPSARLWSMLTRPCESWRPRPTARR